MSTLFMICAVAGGTVLLVQFALMLFGVFDIGVDVVDDVDLGHGDATSAGGAGHAAHAGVAWLWSMVSFRTVVAGTTFFGLVGLAMQSMGASPSLQFSAAMIAGLAAFYGVHALLVGVMKLARDSTLQLDRAIGEIGTVYLSVPAGRSGSGKVHVTVQGRLEEFQAVTASGDKLGVGAKVVVTDVIDGDTLLVEPAAAADTPPPKLTESAT